MQCAHFDAGRCRSCQWLALPYAEQLAQKQHALQQLLVQQPEFTLLPAYASAEAEFRYKAKMVVLGSAKSPELGIVNEQGQEVDLTDCPLYPAAFLSVFADIKRFIQLVDLTPYQVAERRGELKFILLSQSLHSGHFMLRFVLRSKNHLARIQKYLPQLLQWQPTLSVVSVNLQPAPAALLEGAEEIMLSTSHLLREQLNEVPLYLTPQSFFQTNPELAARLYQTAANWAWQLVQQGESITRIWDLFCGVGGFGLHLGSMLRHKAFFEPELVGIEIAQAAITSAQAAAKELGLKHVTFQALDSAAFAQAAELAPDLLVVNPPRRGLGQPLCQDITRLAPRWIIYSSCNAKTQAADLQYLSGYRVVQVQLFDFFAHSNHSEVLMLLQKCV